LRRLQLIFQPLCLRGTLDRSGQIAFRVDVGLDRLLDYTHCCLHPVLAFQCDPSGHVQRRHPQLIHDRRVGFRSYMGNALHQAIQPCSLLRHFKARVIAHQFKRLQQRQHIRRCRRHISRGVERVDDSLPGGEIGVKPVAKRLPQSAAQRIGRLTIEQIVPGGI